MSENLSDIVEEIIPFFFEGMHQNSGFSDPCPRNSKVAMRIHLGPGFSMFLLDLLAGIALEGHSEKAGDRPLRAGPI